MEGVEVVARAPERIALAVTVNGARATYRTEVPFSPHAPILENARSRPVTPLHAAAFIGLCVVGGFIVGVGVAALLSSALGRKLMDAFGLS